MSSPPRTITAYNIMQAVEGDILELVCYRNKGRKKKCIHVDNCEVRNFWKGLREQIESYLKNNTLEYILKLRKREKQ